MTAPVTTLGGVPAIANLRAYTLTAAEIGSLTVATVSRKKFIAFAASTVGLFEAKITSLFLIWNLVVRK